MNGEHHGASPDCEEGVYVEHGVFGRGATATSVLLEGFEVQVDAVLDAQ